MQRAPLPETRSNLSWPRCEHGPSTHVPPSTPSKFNMYVQPLHLKWPVTWHFNLSGPAAFESLSFLITRAYQHPNQVVLKCPNLQGAPQQNFPSAPIHLLHDACRWVVGPCPLSLMLPLDASEFDAPQHEKLPT